MYCAPSPRPRRVRSHPRSNETSCGRRPLHRRRVLLPLECVTCCALSRRTRSALRRLQGSETSYVPWRPARSAASPRAGPWWEASRTGPWPPLPYQALQSPACASWSAHPLRLALPALPLRISAICCGLSLPAVRVPSRSAALASPLTLSGHVQRARRPPAPCPG